MSFTDYIYVTVQNLKSSLQAGLNAFFDAQKDGQIEYSKQSFLQGQETDQAGSISGAFFKVLLTVSTKKPNWLTGKATNCLGSMVPG